MDSYFKALVNSKYMLVRLGLELSPCDNVYVWPEVLNMKRASSAKVWQSFVAQNSKYQACVIG